MVSRFTRNQLIGQTIMFSYTQKKRHPDFNAAVPGIAIDAKRFRIVIYDCDKDCLILSKEPIQYRKNKNKFYDVAGIVLLWAVLHHREVLKKLKSDMNFICKFKIYAKDEFSFFTRLDSYRKNTATVIAQGREPEPATVPFGIQLTERPPKKMKKSS